jgi:hypothetical protein
MIAQLIFDFKYSHVDFPLKQPLNKKTAFMIITNAVYIRFKTNKTYGHNIDIFTLSLTIY